MPVHLTKPAQALLQRPQHTKTVSKLPPQSGEWVRLHSQMEEVTTRSMTIAGANIQAINRSQHSLELTVRHLMVRG